MITVCAVVDHYSFVVCVFYTTDASLDSSFPLPNPDLPQLTHPSKARPRVQKQHAAKRPVIASESLLIEHAVGQDVGVETFFSSNTTTSDRHQATSVGQQAVVTGQKPVAKQRAVSAEKPVAKQRTGATEQKPVAKLRRSFVVTVWFSSEVCRQLNFTNWVIGWEVRLLLSMRLLENHNMLEVKLGVQLQLTMLMMPTYFFILFRLCF